MDENHLRERLDSVRDGKTDIDKALDTLQEAPFVDLGFDKPDSHRALGEGVPGVVSCEGKCIKHALVF